MDVSKDLDTFFNYFCNSAFQISTRLYFIFLLNILFVMKWFCISTFQKIMLFKIVCVLLVLKDLSDQE